MHPTGRALTVIFGLMACVTIAAKYCDIYASTQEIVTPDPVLATEILARNYDVNPSPDCDNSSEGYEPGFPKGGFSKIAKIYIQGPYKNKYFEDDRIYTKVNPPAPNLPKTDLPAATIG